MRIWTVPEADAALPTVKVLLRAARGVHGDLLEASAQLRDLEGLHGRAIRDPDHLAHGEWRAWAAAREGARDRLRQAVRAFEEQDIVIKDVALGLVDFLARLGDESVWLCWRDGEECVRHWHRIEEGFGGRRPIPDAPTV